MSMEQQRTFPVTLESWGWTEQGDREENQDSYLNWAGHLLWAVADGVGGGSHGGTASKAVMHVLLRTPAPSSLDDHIAAVKSRLNIANQIFVEQKTATNQLTASTVVALLMYEGEAACLWAGDSRCYLLRGGMLYQCTRDHTLRQEKIDNGELTVSEAHRMVRGNIITNAIGVQNPLRLEIEKFSVRAGDRFFLCTDGVNGVLSHDALITYLSRPTAKECVDDLAASLAEETKPDNITFVAIFVSDLGGA